MIKCNNRFCTLYNEKAKHGCWQALFGLIVKNCSARKHYDLVMPLPESNTQTKKGMAAMQKAKKAAKKATPAKKPVVAKKSAKGKK